MMREGRREVDGVGEGDLSGGEVVAVVVEAEEKSEVVDSLFLVVARVEAGLVEKLRAAEREGGREK